jgi:hypothetical protein
MSISLEPLALSPRDAAAFLSISKRSLSRLIRAGKIEARKHGPRTLVDVPSLKAYYATANPPPQHTKRCRGPNLPFTSHSATPETQAQPAAQQSAPADQRHLKSVSHTASKMCVLSFRFS